MNIRDDHSKALRAAIWGNALAIDKVKAEDTFQYCLCADCWCAMVLDVAGVRSSHEVEHAILSLGLYHCIEEADTLAKNCLLLLHEDLSPVEIIQSFDVNVWTRVLRTVVEDYPTSIQSDRTRKLFGYDAVTRLVSTLQIVLRFPKRYTSCSPDVLKGYTKFREVHKATREYETSWNRWPGSYIMQLMRQNMREILLPLFDKRPRSERTPGDDSKIVLGISVAAEKAFKRYRENHGSFSGGALYLNQADVGFCPEKADPIWRYNQVVRNLKAALAKGNLGKVVEAMNKESIAKTKHPYRLNGKDLASYTLEEISALKERKMPEWRFLSAETSSLPALKWGSLACDSDYLYTHALLYGYYPPCDVPRTKYSQYKNRQGHMPLPFPVYRKRDVLVSPVPKDYETSRMIAPETSYLNVEAFRVRRLLIDLCTITGYIKMMPPEDQSLNRERAHDGSVMPQGDPYVTLDLSHASDSICRALFFDILPPELHFIVREAISDYMVIETDLVRTSMLATSGSVLTPILQSIFFLTILLTACDLCNAPRDVSCYNDDLICRQSVAATVCELLTLCGLTVNEKKSFVKGPFRESCGGEYINGVDVTGVYWPRHAIRKLIKGKGELNHEDIGRLMSLQHKLFDYPSARAVLEREVLQAVPDMSFSPVGSETDDLWAEWQTLEQSERCRHYKFVSKRVPAFSKGTPEYLKQYYNLGCKLYEFYKYVEWLEKGSTYPDDFKGFYATEHIAPIAIEHDGRTKSVQVLVKADALYKTDK